METTFSFGTAELDVEPRARRQSAREEDETPFRILILGDFSGRASRGVSAPLAGRKPVLIDRDNFDAVLGKLKVTLHLPTENGPGLDLSFGELDDFHPDRLYDSLPMFHELSDLRDRLQDPASFRAAWGDIEPSASARPADPPPAPMPALTSGSLLDEMAEESEIRRAAHGPGRMDPLRAYVRDIVAPYLTPGPHPKQAELTRQVDSAISGQMRSLLHHPSFQSLESIWRGLYFAVRGIDTSTRLKVYVLDATKAEIAADLAHPDMTHSTLFRMLVEETVQTPGAEPWSLLAGIYTFSPGLKDLELLARLSVVAQRSGAPLLSAAHSRVLGCESIVQTPHPRDWAEEPMWNEVRQFPGMDAVGLALPRFLLRLPYGPKTDATERFVFDEMPEGSTHEDYLWGHPAFACVALIAEAFSEAGWDMRPGLFQNLHGLPAHVRKDTDGELVMKPCAEVLLTEQAASAMIDRGLMPLLSMKGSDTVRVGMFQSVRGGALRGRWRG